MAQGDDPLADCKSNEHDLIEIKRIPDDSIGLAEQIVRWCRICGSIRIDIDYDGRTNTGQVMPMRSPVITRFACPPEIKVEILSEQVISNTPAKLTIHNGDKAIAVVQAKVIMNMGADGGLYPCVALSIEKNE